MDVRRRLLGYPTYFSVPRPPTPGSAGRSPPREALSGRPPGGFVILGLRSREAYSPAEIRFTGLDGPRRPNKRRNTVNQRDVRGETRTTPGPLDPVTGAAFYPYSAQ